MGFFGHDPEEMRMSETMLAMLSNIYAGMCTMKCRMHLQSARRQARTQLHLEGFGLLFALAVNKTIVGISTPW